MPRALAEIRARVPADGRDAFVRRARERWAALQVLGVSYWVFEATDGSGDTVQYVETSDDARMQAARAAIELVAGEHLVLLHQLELSVER